MIYLSRFVTRIADPRQLGNGAVQVLLFRDRLEIWNPGHLPHELSLSKLKKPHNSVPANPLLADPLYWSGMIERLGTGTLDMVQSCVDAGLKEPEFHQADVFRSVLWRAAKSTAPMIPPMMNLLKD